MEGQLFWSVEICISAVITERNHSHCSQQHCISAHIPQGSIMALYSVWQAYVTGGGILMDVHLGWSESGIRSKLFVLSAHAQSAPIELSVAVSCVFLFVINNIHTMSFTALCLSLCLVCAQPSTRLLCLYFHPVVLCGYIVAVLTSGRPALTAHLLVQDTGATKTPGYIHSSRSFLLTSDPESCKIMPECLCLQEDSSSQWMPAMFDQTTYIRI